VISGFEHNAVTRPLHSLKADVQVAGRRLFDPEDTVEAFEKALRGGAEAAVFTHVSNVFGYILPVEALSALCRKYSVPFIIDAAQSAGTQKINMEALGADFIAMPGHKGLLGPQGTGILLCGRNIEPLICGGTGNLSIQQDMPADLPERGEAGTANVPGICGLHAGLEYLLQTGVEYIGKKEARQAKRCAAGLKKLGFTVFMGEHQGGTVSFVPDADCEDAASRLAKMGIAVRAGLHCAPLAHESAGTLETGTIRVSFGHDATPWQTEKLLRAAEKLKMKS
jgi:selenocysteine lyase/cysteine desulfurase